MARKKTKARQKTKTAKKSRKTSKLADVSRRLNLERLVVRLEAAVERLEQTTQGTQPGKTRDLGDDESDRPTVHMGDPPATTL